MSTKGELVNRAYARGRISGLTSNPSPEETTLALQRLENMAQEFFGRNIDVGYFFEDTPDSASPHNIPYEFWDAFETNLAVRLLGDFGKQPLPDLSKFAMAGFSFLSSKTAPIKQTQYPERMPRGSGNTLRYNRWQQFYRQYAEVPLKAESIQMYIGDVENFTEHFDEYLRTGETIASYTLTADTGLTVSNESLSSPDLSYTVTATGTSASTAVLEIVIVATTSASRVTTRKINFELKTR